MKRLFIKINWFLIEQLGMNFLRFFKSIKGIFWFARDYFIFSKNNRNDMEIMPCLHDRYDEAGAVNSGYFWMDLMVARWVFEKKPKKHIDIGSRIDGFVAHVASFRDLDVVDIRPVTSYVAGINFVQADAMSVNFFRNVRKKSYDSVSCLYAIEHFGLGRYGDLVDPNGYRKGLKNISELLSAGGVLYLSTPVGRQRVEFNANWIFDPCIIVNFMRENDLHLKKFIIINPKVGPEVIQTDEESLSEISKRDYEFGVFLFVKGCD